jgi:hypothetical protein
MQGPQDSLKGGFKLGGVERRKRSWPWGRFCVDTRR